MDVGAVERERLAEDDSLQEQHWMLEERTSASGVKGWTDWDTALRHPIHEGFGAEEVAQTRGAGRGGRACVAACGRRPVGVGGLVVGGGLVDVECLMLLLRLEGAGTTGLLFRVADPCGSDHRQLR